MIWPHVEIWYDPIKDRIFTVFKHTNSTFYIYEFKEYGPRLTTIKAPWNLMPCSEFICYLKASDNKLKLGGEEKANSIEPDFNAVKWGGPWGHGLYGIPIVFYPAFSATLRQRIFKRQLPDSKMADDRKAWRSLFNLASSAPRRLFNWVFPIKRGVDA